MPHPAILQLRLHMASFRIEVRKIKNPSNLRFLHRSPRGGLWTPGLSSYKSSPTTLFLWSQQLQTPKQHQDKLTTPNIQTQQPLAIMHASIILTTVALTATALAGPLLETRACPVGPYKEGSSCDANCLGALKCSDNLYDVVCTNPPFSTNHLASFLSPAPSCCLHSFVPPWLPSTLFPFFCASLSELKNKV